MTIPRHLLIACVLAICPGATLFVCCMHARDIANGYSIIGSTSGFLPASIKAAPDLECRLHARGSAITSGLPIFTDGDGYARFYALKGNTIGRYQTLTCTDNDGRRHTYNLDLVSKAYFVKRPLDLSKERGIERPPLTGDPLSYTQAELSQKGYGLRPKPDAQIYSVWLEAARKPARMLFAKKPDVFVHQPHLVTPLTSPNWTGSVMTGSAPYVSVVAMFHMPDAIPGPEAAAVIWPGLGGFFDGKALIQAGAGLWSKPSTAIYFTWREYCCGNSDSNGYGGNFIPAPGDKILVSAWYCDDKGEENIVGGFGCAHVHDLTSGQVLNCTLPKGTKDGEPCWSVKALPSNILCSDPDDPAKCTTIGASAEFILENVSPQPPIQREPFPRFTPFRIVGVALTTAGTITWVDIDPVVYLLRDYTIGPPRITVTLPGNANTAFRAGPKRGRKPR